MLRPLRQDRPSPRARSYGRDSRRSASGPAQRQRPSAGRRPLLRLLHCRPRGRRPATAVWSWLAGSSSDASSPSGWSCARRFVRPGAGSGGRFAARGGSGESDRSAGGVQGIAFSLELRHRRRTKYDIAPESRSSASAHWVQEKSGAARAALLFGCTRCCAEVRREPPRERIAHSRPRSRGVLTKTYVSKRGGRSSD